MNTFMLITGALMVGVVLGFFLAACLSMGRDALPARPEELTATPEEIVAVYEAKREMEKRNAPGPVETPRRGVSTMSREDDETVMVDYFPMSRKALKGWEKEQSKREKRRVR